MRIEEIGLKIQRLKYDTEVLKTEIERVNSHTRKMSRDLQAATRQINQLPLLLNRAVPPTGTKNANWLEKSKSVISERLLELLKPDSYKIGLYTLDVRSRKLHFQEEEYALTRKEFLVLVLFAANLNAFIERETFLTTIWAESNYQNSRSMDVYICKIRKLLSEDSGINVINVHAKGFTMWVEGR